MGVRQRPPIVDALAYARLGFRIVPVHSVTNGQCSCRGGTKCSGPGKHPRIGRWPEKASSDPAQIRSWSNKWKSPRTSFGVATGGESGVVVLDVDGEAGKQTLQQLAEADPSILETRTHQTGGGGFHLFYQHPGFVCGNSVKSLPGIDIRGDGGLIILPPALHKSGQRYKVLKHLPIVPLPNSLRHLFQGCHKEIQGVTRNNNELLRVTKQGVGVVVMESECQNSLQPCIPNPLLSVTLCVDQVAWALKQSLPTEQGTRYRQVFALARHLASVDGITQDIPVIHLRPFVVEWHQMAVEQAKRLEFSINGDFEESWSDFQSCWGRVKHPVGESLRKVFDHVAAMDADGEVDPIVWNALAHFNRTEDRAMRILISVLFALAQCSGVETFSLACHAGAKELSRLGIDVDGKWVHRRLRSLSLEGIIICVDRGQASVSEARKAAQFRWAWTMKDLPGNAVAGLLDGL